MDKQFVAVSCHYDILDWLEPDWVYDTDKMEFVDVKKKSTSDQKLPWKSESAVQNYGRSLGVITI